MVRFDFGLDKDLNVYLMEANMSPNLSSDKYPPNMLIYEPVIYSLFSMVGITRYPQIRSWVDKPFREWNILVLDKDLAILPDVCTDTRCVNGSSEVEEECDTCYQFLTDDFKLILKDAYLEEYSRWHNKRLIPSTSEESPMTLGTNNYLQDKWYIGKCLLDAKWCN